MESVGLGGPRWHGSNWQRGIAESGSSRLSTFMIEICGDLVWDLPCVQQASYLEGGPLMWLLPLYLQVNQNSDYDVDMNISLIWSLDHTNNLKSPCDFLVLCLKHDGIGVQKGEFAQTLAMKTLKVLITLAADDTYIYIPANYFWGSRGGGKGRGREGVYCFHDHPSAAFWSLQGGGGI